MCFDWNLHRPTAYESARFRARESSRGGVIDQQHNISKHGFCKHPFSPSYSFFFFCKSAYKQLGSQASSLTDSNSQILKFNPLAQPMFFFLHNLPPFNIYFNILSGPLSRVAGENVLISDSAHSEGLSARANVIFYRLHE